MWFFKWWLDWHAGNSAANAVLGSSIGKSKYNGDPDAMRVAVIIHTVGTLAVALAAAVFTIILAGLHSYFGAAFAALVGICFASIAVSGLIEYAKIKRGLDKSDKR